MLSPNSSFSSMAATAAKKFTALAESSSASTQRGKKSAVVQYDLFAGLQQYENLEDSQQVDLCNVSRFQEFGKYLCEAAVDKDSGDLIMLGTALQYISGIKELIKKKYPENEIFSPTAIEWYTKLREDMTSVICARCILGGVAICDKAPNLGRKIMGSMCLYLMSVNSKEAAATRLSMAMSWQCIGRTGEASKSTWDLSEWDMDLGK